MQCAGKMYCKLYKDKSQCKKVAERQKNHGICDCRHARLLCQVSECAWEKARGAMHCDHSFYVHLSDLMIGRFPEERSQNIQSL